MSDNDFERDYKILLMKYKNSEWKDLKERNDWRLRLEVMEEFDEKLRKDRLRREIYDKYFNEGEC